MAEERTLALQAGIVTRLSAGEDIIALGLDARGNVRVYDRVPKGTVPPYYRVGNNDQDIPNKADCYDGSELFLEIEAFGNREAVGKSGVKRMAGVALELLDECEDEIDVEGYRLQVLEKYRVDFNTEPDGLTERALITLRAIIEPS